MNRQYIGICIDGELPDRIEPTCLISGVIAELEKIKAKHGNLPFYYDNDGRTEGLPYPEDMFIVVEKQDKIDRILAPHLPDKYVLL